MSDHAGLWMGEELRFPPDIITETILIIAKRGSGKTYSASVLVEEMVGAGLPVCGWDCGCPDYPPHEAQDERPGVPIRENNAL